MPSLLCSAWRSLLAAVRGTRSPFVNAANVSSSSGEDEATVADIKGVKVVITPAFWKLTDIVLAVLQAAKANNQLVTTAEMVKTVFLADCAQLNLLGRPISFDSYKAMLNGPVGSALYDLLLAETGDEILKKTKGVKWTRTYRPDIANGTFVFHDPTEQPDTKSILARDDVQALGEALAEVKRLGFFGVRDKTHDHKAYQAAWRDDPVCKAFTMRYEDLLDVPDMEVLQNVAAMSAAGGAR